VSDRALDETRAWVELAVIGLNLCPFAKAPQIKGQVRYALSGAGDVEALLADLVAELKLLAATSTEKIETTLLVHPHVLSDFADYNDFLDIAEAAVAELGLEGVIQVASFHPRYRFADSDEDDMANATNRSPWPTLHLLREESVERAVAAFPEGQAIYEANIETLRRLGASGWNELQRRIRREGESTG
jgi:hypothetical protein